MESRNPVFSRNAEFRADRPAYATSGAPSAYTPDDLQSMYDAPSATGYHTGRMTLDDVVMRCAIVFGTLLVAAAATYALVKPEQFGLVIVAALVGMVLGLVNSFKRTPSPALIIAYAAVEGVFVGGISRAYESLYDGIVAQAVLGTLAAFGSMLFLFKSGRLRATPRFQRVLVTALVGYLVFGLVHLLGAVFGWWPNIYTTGGLGLVVSAFGVVLASLFLILDFDFVEKGIRAGIPQQYAWTAAFGLAVTLIWLYLEILRLISILRD